MIQNTGGTEYSRNDYMEEHTLHMWKNKQNWFHDSIFFHDSILKNQKMVCRNYLHVVGGSIKIKLISPIYSKYLYEHKDYENFEFRSPINPWVVQKNYEINFNVRRVLSIKKPRGFLFWFFLSEAPNWRESYEKAFICDGKNVTKNVNNFVLHL